MKYRKNLRTVYSSRHVFGASNLDIRLYDTKFGRQADSKFSPKLKNTIETLANQITFDESMVDNSVISPDIYVTLTNYSPLYNIDYAGDAYSVTLSVIVDYGKFVADPDWYSVETLSYKALFNEYRVYDDGSYELEYASQAKPTPDSIVELLDIYEEYGDDGSRIRFFNDRHSAERYYDSTQRKTSNEFGPISKKEIIDDAKESLEYPKSVRYKYAGVLEAASDITMDDLLDGNYSDNDRITFRVNVSYGRNSSFIGVMYVYKNGDWVCRNTNYDFSDEAAEILRELRYPID